MKEENLLKRITIDTKVMLESRDKRHKAHRGTYTRKTRLRSYL